jgi:hypothetical protein
MLFIKRTNRQRWATLLQTLCFGLALFNASTAQAGFLELIKKMNTDTLTWRVHVVDKQGHAIPAPTVWRIIPNGNDQENVDLMQRMVRRYAADADFIKNNVHPSLLVNYANKDGVFIDTDIVNYHKTSDITTIYAVIKRGYIPTVLSDVAHKNMTHDVTIVLESDTKAQVDIRMLQLDLIRASAYIPAATGVEIMQEDRRQILLQAHQKLRNLAQSLEQDHQDDMASAAYYNLAYLPSVDVIKKADGSEAIIGYANGYTPDNPQRKADKIKATELNRSNPNILMGIFERNLGISSKNYFQLSSPERKAYIEYTEKLIQQHGERIWPIIVRSIVYQYQGEGLYAEACSALKRAYQFEPTYQAGSEWASLLNRLNKEASRAGYQGQSCNIEGLTS